MDSTKINTFDRSKIYEKLTPVDQPKEYNKKLPWVVQQQIAATNGMHYIDRLGKLKDYPKYQLPVPKVSSGIMLDIGNGWGRWLVAGANKGYIPVGIDIRLEFCEAALKTLRDNNRNGYSLVADLKNLPFQSNIFDLVWSFSVIQHTHKQRLLSCLTHINRILKNSGFTFLEFPNKYGLRNRYRGVKESSGSENDYDSWCVRYYSIKEYRDIFNDIFGNFKYYNHSFIGIGILSEDLKYVSVKNKFLVGVSLLGSMITNLIPPLKQISDSIYIKAYKNQSKGTQDERAKAALHQFTTAHSVNPANNLNIIYLLSCPITGGALTLSDDKEKLISIDGKVSYPIKNNIPVLIPSEASAL